MFYQLDDIEYTQVLPGFLAKFIHSDRMTFVFWQIEAGAELPEHSHEHEQVCNVLEGKFSLTIDGQTQVLQPGQVAVIPSMATHSGRALTSCRVMDVFQPIREDYRLG
jgi:quercetin dioxygenase-like cupin family protein